MLIVFFADKDDGFSFDASCVFYPDSCVIMGQLILTIWDYFFNPGHLIPSILSNQTSDWNLNSHTDPKL